MFQIMRRTHASLPLASALIGVIGKSAILAVPPAVTAAYLLAHDLIIRRRVG